MKRVVIVTVGSQGDVEPCFPLARALREGGGEVTLAALEPFRGRAQTLGVHFVALGELPGAFRGTPRWRPNFTGWGGRALFWAAYQRLLGGYLPAFERACEGADLIVHTGLAFPAYHMAEALGVPCAALSFVPGAATAEFVHPLFAARRLSGGPRWNRATYAAEQAFMAHSTAHLINPWRRRLGLRPVPRWALPAHRWASTQAVICAVSRHIVPRPPDWSPRVHLTGSLAPDEAPLRPQERLEAFLAAGERPVYVGFGSMSAHDAQHLTREVIAALASLGLRGVLARGWGGLTLPPQSAPHIHLIDEVPHGWLFARVRAAVHHGGAGTTAAALRAGLVSVVVPFDYDQPFWGRLLAHRGLGPDPIPRPQCTARRLAAALRQALHTPAYATRIAPIAEGLRTEDGAHNAAQALQKLLGEPSQSVTP